MFGKLSKSTFVLPGNTPLDIVLLLDSSDKYRSVEFQSEKVFLKDFVDRLDPENTDARLSLYTYGSSAFSQFTLDMYSTAGEMKQAVDFMWFATGNGTPEPAIQTTVNEVFQDHSNGNRECVPNILVLLTHSELSDTVLINNVSEDLSSMLVKCIIINMAGTVAQTAFQTLTNGTTTVLQVDDFATLETSAASVFQSVKASM